MRLVGDDVADDLGRSRVRGGMVEHHSHVAMDVAAEEVDAAQAEIRALAGRHHMHFLPNKLAARVHQENRHLGIGADPRADLTEMGRGLRLVLDDQPVDLGTVADLDIRHRADQRISRAGLPLDDGRLRALAEAGGEARMDLAARMDVLQFDRRRDLGALGDRQVKSIRDESGVDRADRIVRLQRREIARERAAHQAVGNLLDPHPVHAGMMLGVAVDDGQDRRTIDQRSERAGVARATIGGNGRQQAAQIGVVPGLDAARRQAGLEDCGRRVALGRDFRRARQRRTARGEALDQGLLGARQLGCCVNVHVSHPAQAASPMMPA